MRDFEKKIDKLLSKILSEEIDSKSMEMANKVDNGWVEIDVKENLKGGQYKLDVAKPKGKLTSADFKKLRSGNKGPFKNRVKKKMDFEEQETQEGNAFTKALSDAKRQGKNSFEVDGKKYSVKESSRTLKLTESELIDLIEKIVNEQKDSKNNISVKSPKGHNVTKTVLGNNKKQNDSNTKEVSKKMSEYLKDGSKGEYNENPEHFPKGNGEIEKMKKRAYTPSKAVEEYIESFAHPGMENLHYDEIKPNEEWVTDNIEGSSRTGNNPDWANAVKTDLGKKINDKRRKNLYRKEKERSYNRVAQPVDEAGEGEGENSIDKMFSKLESKSDKKNNIIIGEELNKMKNLINYSVKTQ